MVNNPRTNFFFGLLQNVNNSTIKMIFQKKLNTKFPTSKS